MPERQSRMWLLEYMHHLGTQWSRCECDMRSREIQAGRRALCRVTGRGRSRPQLLHQAAFSKTTCEVLERTGQATCRSLHRTATALEASSGDFCHTARNAAHELHFGSVDTSGKRSLCSIWEVTSYQMPSSVHS